MASDFPFVLLELGFPFALGADASPLLSKVRPGANQPWQRIFHASQIDLQAGLPGLGPLGKNIQNHFLPVDHKHACEFFPVSLLRGSQLVVENQHICCGLLSESGNFLCFARTHQVAGVGLSVVHKLPAHNRNTERVDEFHKLIQQAGSIAFTRRATVGANERRFFYHFWFFFDFEHSANTSLHLR